MSNILLANSETNKEPNDLVGRWIFSGIAFEGKGTRVDAADFLDELERVLQVAYPKNTYETSLGLAEVLYKLIRGERYVFDSNGKMHSIDGIGTLTKCDWRILSTTKDKRGSKDIVQLTADGKKAGIVIHYWYKNRTKAALMIEHVVADSDVAYIYLKLQ